MWKRYCQKENHVTFEQHERQYNALPRLCSLRVRSHYSSCLTSEGKRLPQLAGQTVKPFPRRKSAPILIRFVARVPRKRAQHDNCFSTRGTTKILLLPAARRWWHKFSRKNRKSNRLITHTHKHTYVGVLSNPDEFKSGGNFVAVAEDLRVRLPHPLIYREQFQNSVEMFFS